MSNNREKRIHKENVHLYIALQRTGTSKDKKCFRHVIKETEIDLRIVEEKCKLFGGDWRIHHTVNSRNCEKARKILMKNLIDYPEKASCIDSEWRTALLNRNCKSTNFFMLDIDTQDTDKILYLESLIPKSTRLNWDKPNYVMYSTIFKKFKSPKGWHYITHKFDTREICKLDYITLLRDGYFFIKEIKENK